MMIDQDFQRCSTLFDRGLHYRIPLNPIEIPLHPNRNPTKSHRNPLTPIEIPLNPIETRENPIDIPQKSHRNPQETGFSPWIFLSAMRPRGSFSDATFWAVVPLAALSCLETTTTTAVGKRILMGICILYVYIYIYTCTTAIISP